MDVLDSRRLTGPNVFWDVPGAVLDLALAPEEADRAVASWEREARRLLDGVGWSGERTTHRRWAGGVSLVLSAPVDALYAATEVNEAAWAAASGLVRGLQPPDPRETVAALRASIAEEANPPLLRVAEAAAEHGVGFFSDDDAVSVGMGDGSATWPARDLPEPGSLDWTRIHDVPSVLVTGTNGKTTTVRMLAAVAAAAGRVPGSCTTDGIRVGPEVVEPGDWSGPGGARRVLRDPRVGIAVLETARGGILRRGLAVRRCDVAVLTNLAADHLGEWGVEDLDRLADAKLVAARVASQVVVNADDPTLARRIPELEKPLTWFSLDPGNPIVRTHAAAGGRVCLEENGNLVLREAGDVRVSLPVGDVPATWGGAAVHNVANALAALGAAWGLGLGAAAAQAGLAGFEGGAGDNPGRLNLIPVGGLRVVVDYAHNPHGMNAILETLSRLPARRRLVVLGQAGDRDDAAIRELARTVWRFRPDRLVVKELEPYLRGRDAGVVPEILADELRRAGAPEEAIDRAGSELEAVRAALAWGGEGDLLLLPCHVDRDAVLTLMETLRERGWKAGDPLPPA